MHEAGLPPDVMNIANPGQICGPERIMIDSRIDDTFAERLVARTRATKLSLGDRRKGPVVPGSVVEVSTVECCNALIGDALAKAAKLLCGGRVDSTLMPAMPLDNVMSDIEIYHEESFGSVKGIVRVDRVEEAVACANDSQKPRHKAFPTSTAQPCTMRHRCRLAASRAVAWAALAARLALRNLPRFYVEGFGIQAGDR